MFDPCDFCGGEMGVLGILGRLVHLQCRNCGSESEMHTEQLEQWELEHLMECMADDAVSGFWDVDADVLQP